MSAEPRIADRPFLRVFAPEAEVTAYSLQNVFDLYRWPDLKAKSSAGDGKRWMRLWCEFEQELALAQRTTYPLAVSSIGSREIKAFQLWLAEDDRYPLPKGASSINKAVKEVLKVLSLAAEEGLEVQHVRPPKHLKAETRPRYYYDDQSVERLWTVADSMDWPPAHDRAPRRGNAFRGSGVEPVVFWRSLIVLLRNYGMRVQDLAAYARGKKPILWCDVSFDPRSPNPESLETWPLGWLHYRSSKTGRPYYLPLTPSARGAIDRLRAGAFALHGGTIPRDAPVISLPKSHGLTDHWRAMQVRGDVATRSGDAYQLEDFRKTVATYAATVDTELPYSICGWGQGGGVKATHYQQPEPLLVRKLPQCPLPACFDAWSNPDHVRQCREFVERL